MTNIIIFIAAGCYINCACIFCIGLHWEKKLTFWSCILGVLSFITAPCILAFALGRFVSKIVK